MDGPGALLLEAAINAVLRDWDVLQTAVANDWGGVHSSDKALTPLQLLLGLVNHHVTQTHF